MPTAIELLEDRLGDYVKQLSAIDELAQVVLKGHLDIEASLDDVIKAFFFYPEYILESRPGFDRKVAIAKALAIRSNEFPIWKEIEAINELRNSIAHGHDNKKRKDRMAAVRKLYLQQAKPELA